MAEFNRYLSRPGRATDAGQLPRGGAGWETKIVNGLSLLVKRSVPDGPMMQIERLQAMKLTLIAIAIAGLATGAHAQAG
jgi:hypothetical protein